MRVLIVEDETPIRNLIAAVLKREHIEADTAENGREALGLLSRRQYACIVLDLMMPVMSGRELVAWLSDVPNRPPVILLTAATDSLTDDLPPEVVKLIIRKPFDIARVLEAVRAFVSASETRRQQSTNRADSAEKPDVM